MMAKMHQSLQDILPKRAFVAASFAVIDLEDRTLTHFNAALPHPILLRNGKSVELHIHSEVPLGCPLGAEYVGTSVELRSGDVLLLFRDGFPEARGVNGQAYEKIWLRDLLSSFVDAQKSAQAWLEAILNDVRAFTLSGEPTDDMTVVVVKVLS